MAELNTEHANDRQVSGDHYKSTYQHWDFVLDTNQNYLQGNATKYLSRWRKKGGTDDLRKAQHYVQKAREVSRQKIPFDARDFWRFVWENELHILDGAVIWAVMSCDWDSADAYISALINYAPKPSTLQPI